VLEFIFSIIKNIYLYVQKLKIYFRPVPPGRSGAAFSIAAVAAFICSAVAANFLMMIPEN